MHVPGFAFRSASTLHEIDSPMCWNHHTAAADLLLHIHDVTRSATSQQCSVRHRFGECGDRFSTVNSWCVTLLEAGIRRWVHCGNRGMGMVSNNSLAVKSAPRGPKCDKKVYLTQLDHHQHLELFACFHVVYTKFWPYHPNVAAEIDAIQSFSICHCLIFVSLCEI